MPDVFGIISRKWKFIFGFSLLSLLLALAIVLFVPKKYLSVATALPANSMVADKARLFNTNIETLYSDFGSPDELDKIEGTASLDTIFIAASKDLALPKHYAISENTGNALLEDDWYRGAMKLKKNSSIIRSGYGELKVKVWDTDRYMAAILANKLMQELQDLHQHLLNERNDIILQKLKEDQTLKEKQLMDFTDSIQPSAEGNGLFQMKKSVLQDQLMEEEKMIGQYQLAMSTHPQVLLIVEGARPSLKPDLPRVLPTLLLTLFGSLVFAFLVTLFMESRKISGDSQLT